MEISKIFGINRSVTEKKYNSGVNSYHLSPLKKDTVSFGALKKSQFQGIDLLLINKFNAPVQKFNTNDDFQIWCKNRVNEIINKDYKGRRDETVTQRKAMLKEWFNYVQNENDAYNNAIQLLILDGITKDLQPDTDEIPPVLNKGVLAQTIDDIQKKIKISPNIQINFSKQYKLNVQNSIFETAGDEVDETKTGWVKIPSYNNDPENFETNVEKLKMLSHHNWCTKSFNAEPYLKQGDFHVYLEKGKPKLGVRFVGDKIEEIQGEKNDSKIPIDYLDIVKDHISDTKLSNKADKEMKSAEKAVIKVNGYKNKYFPNGIENYSVEYIFKVFNIGAKRDKDGLLILSEYRQPDEDFSWKTLGIDENNLIKEVKGIDGIANFCHSDIIKLENLKYIGRSAWFGHSRILSLGNLQYIGDDGVFNHSAVKDFGELRTIKGSAFFNNAKVENLKNLRYVGETLALGESNVKDLGDLKYIGRDAKLNNSKVTSLKNVSYIGGDAQLEQSSITDLGNLKKVGENMIFPKISDIGKLQYVGGLADFTGSEITDLKNFKYAGEIYVKKGQKELINELEKRNLLKEDKYKLIPDYL